MAFPPFSKSRYLFLTATTIVLIASLLPSFDHLIRHFFNLSNKGNYYYSSGKSEVIPINGAFGPESFAFDRNGDGPYTGVSDGRIIKWQGNESRWIDFAVTSTERSACEGPYDASKEHICGRPLGLSFNKETGHLYIADAYMGLLVVGPNGGLATKVANEARGIPFGFTNSLDIDQTNGVVYFTDSSTKFQRRNYVSVIVSGDKTGRLMKFDPKSKKVTVLLENLMFPNGVSLSQNGDFLLLAETTTCRILKVWLKTSKIGQVEAIAEVPGFPDNIKRNQKGEFWVGINSRRASFMKWALSKDWIVNALVNSPFDLTKMHSYVGGVVGHGMAIRLSKEGGIVEILEEMNGEKWKVVSEVEENNGNLWVGSVKLPFAIKARISS